MSKAKAKPNLATALNRTAKGPDAGPPVAVSQGTAKSPTRQGRIMVSGWLPIAARSSFRLIQVAHPEKKMQDLVTEAMNDLFAKYNVPQTAGDK